MVDNFVRSYLDIIEILVTPEMLKFAQENAHKGSMNRRSMLEGARNVEGLLGELAIIKYLPMLNHTPTRDYDFKFKLLNQVLTIDGKNKFDVKKFGTQPRLDWDCTIFGYEAEKSCQAYLFTSTDEHNSKVWLKGYIEKKNFVVPENFYPAGSERRSTQGRVTYREDNYVTQVQCLRKVSYLKSVLEKKFQELQNVQTSP